MLTTIRKNMHGIFAKFIVVLMLIPFVLFGVDSLVGFSGPSTVAEINGEKLTEVDLARAVDNQKRRIIASAGENLDYSLLDDNKLREPALKQLINQQLVKQFAAEQGLKISDSLINNAILSMEQFQDNGRFSQANYENLLANMGYTPAYFKTLVSQDLAQSHLVNGFIGNNFVTPEQLELIASLLAERRSFQYAQISPESFRATVSVTDEEISSYYQNNQPQFLAQEKLKVEYIQLKESDFYKPVTEDVLKQAYEKEMAGYKGEASRHAAHILLEINDKTNEAQAKAKAQELAEKIKAGADFAELAKANSDDVGSKEQGGDIGYSSGDVFDPAFEEALTKLKVGEVSEPVKTEFGIHLIKLLDEKASEKPAFAEYKSILERRIQQQEAAPEFARISEQLKDLAFNAEDLQEPAQKLALKIQKSDWIDRDAKRNQGLFSDDRLVRAAFADEVLNDGQNSEVVELSPDNIVVVHKTEYQPQETLPLEKVKEIIRAALINQKASAAALAKAEDLRKKIESGEGFETVAKANNVAIKVVANQQRQEIEAAPQLVDFAFAQPHQPGVAVATLPTGDAVVLQTQSVKPGNLADFSDIEKQALTSSIVQAQANADFATMMSDLHKKADVEINLK